MATGRQVRVVHVMEDRPYVLQDEEKVLSVSYSARTGLLDLVIEGPVVSVRPAPRPSRPPQPALKRS